MRLNFIRLSALLCIVTSCILCGPIATAIEFRLIAPPAVKHGDYEAKLLQLALDHLDGKHELTFVTSSMSQERQLRALASGSSKYNVHYSGYSKQRESLLKLVPVPLTRGLLGHRLLIMQREQSDRIRAVKSLTEMTEKISLATGANWPDKTILRGAGFTVLAGSKFWGLLGRGRIDAIPLGVDEIASYAGTFAEKSSRKADFIVHSTHLLSYQYDSFFYVAPDDIPRANLIEEGLRRAYKSGAYMKLFRTFPPIAEGLEFVEQTKPIVLRVENTELSETIRAIPTEFWHRFSP